MGIQRGGEIIFKVVRFSKSREKFLGKFFLFESRDDNSRTFSVSGSFLLRLQAGDRFPRPVQHFGAYLYSSGGGARGWRGGGPGSGPTTGSRAQLQRRPRIIRTPATRAALRHPRFLYIRSC